MSTTDERQAMLVNLHRLADLLAERDDLPLPEVEITWHIWDAEDQRVEGTRVRRALGVGEWSKHSGGSSFWFKGARGPIELTIFADREQVCTRRVVGTETVTLPAVEAQPERVEVREIVERDCAPVLGAAS